MNKLCNRTLRWRNARIEISYFSYISREDMKIRECNITWLKVPKGMCEGINTRGVIHVYYALLMKSLECRNY